MGRPRIHATDADRRAAFAKKWAVKSVRLDTDLADTIKRLADFTEESESEVMLSLMKFALLNRSWFTLGLFGKRSGAASYRRKDAAAQRPADDDNEQESDTMPKANPLTRVRIKSPPQRPAGNTDAPSPRLVKRRKKTAKAPRGVYANPAPKAAAREPYAVYKADAKGQPKGRPIGRFAHKEDAFQYACAYAPSHGVRVVVIGPDK